MLEGKTVKIVNKDLLLNFYPDYQLKEVLFFDNSSRVIYCGKSRKNLLDYLGNNTLSFINTVGPYDYDLDDRDNLIEFVFDKHNKKPKESTVDLLRNMIDDDFYYNIKLLWFTGRLVDIEDAEYTIYDLYKNLTKSKHDLLRVYFGLLKFTNPKVIEASLLTFFEKSFNQDIEVSPGYRKLLNSFKDRRGSKLKALLNRYRSKRFARRPVGLRLLWLLLNI